MTPHTDRANMHVRVRGLLRVRLLREDGSVRVDSGWFPNLITDAGLDMFGGVYPAGYAMSSIPVAPYQCAVGTGNTAPAYKDTALVSEVGHSTGLNPPVSSSPKYNAGYNSASPAYLYATGVFVFALGAIVGNLAEIGTGATTTATPSTLYLFSRALIVDGGGSPTTISVTSADQLEVTYQLRLYVDLTDAPYSITISGVNYTGVVRRASLGTASEQVVTSLPTTIGANVYNGTIGSVTGSPSGSSAFLNSGSISYTAGTYFASYTFSFGTGDGNLAGGISAMQVQISPFGYWQLSFSPAIAKDNTKTLTLTYNISWARYP